ncbi:seizure 6-like protein isoform X2 [Oncorhynchus kisutch]|uniref:seizure 6-like protein isoform X2 n=1 Tax=Oncorhynchus kisutch TaxID=8019 RepID=UPI0012DDEFEB|nr:seizure 6-like protein isoform X2 [Oncorhynchus kisutch]
MPPGHYRIGALSALLCVCVIWTGLAAETQGEVDSTQPSPSPSQAVGDTDIDSSRGRSSVVGLVPGAGMGATGDLLESFLAQKDRLLYQTRGVVLPSAQPQDLLPLLGRGLSVRGLSGGLSMDQQGLLKRIGSLVSQPHDSGPLLPSQPSQSYNNPIPSSSQPGTHTSTSTSLGQRDEVTAIVMATMAAATPSPDVSGCMVNFSDPEGYIDSSDDPPLPDGTFLHCTYTVTVYTGYGVELQVKSVNLSEGEQLSIRGVDEGGALLVLANHTLLVEGQVIRSPTNTISVYYRSLPEGGMGMFQLHYQIFRLSCALPRRPHFGEVSVLDLLPGGTARFHCHMGYHLQGAVALTCLNASLPVWSSKEPSCRALCGGSVKNATVGRVLSPSPRLGPDATQDRSCSWSMEAPTAQRLHLHLERLALGPTERLVLWSGLDAGSVVLFDSGRGGPIPFEGVISEGPAVRVQFITDQPNHNTGFNIRYEAFKRGHCYEPYLQNGNFSTTDQAYGVGAVVQFSCDTGHSLEQGPPVIECINARDPYWNDTEPLCKALCGGDLAGPGGVILSPNWPEWYGEGEDCSWRIHVGEDKCVLLDVQLLNLSDSDMLTILDGDEVTTHILGQYVGGPGPFKIQSTTPDLTVTFHSDPAGLVFGKGEGFIINYMEVSRNDSCPDLPEIQNGWKTTSHTALVRGARITYQCDPGYDLVGRETLTCQLDLTWSTQPPFCEKIMYCSDPGHVEHSTRSLSDPKLLVGTTIQYSCYPGFILQGGATLTCYGREPGTPVWTSKLPHCVFVEAAAGSGLDGGNMALAIFILVLLLSVLLGGAYVYITRCRYHSNLRLPLIYPHPYSQITVESEFDNPLYETGGDNREYEVSI